MARTGAALKPRWLLAFPNPVARDGKAGKQGRARGSRRRPRPREPPPNDSNELERAAKTYTPLSSGGGVTQAKSTYARTGLPDGRDVTCYGLRSRTRATPRTLRIRGRHDGDPARARPLASRMANWHQSSTAHVTGCGGGPARLARTVGFDGNVAPFDVWFSSSFFLPGVLIDWG